jgi:hypothetical protein
MNANESIFSLASQLIRNWKPRIRAQNVPIKEEGEMSASRKQLRHTVALPLLGSEEGPSKVSYCY